MDHCARCKAEDDGDLLALSRFVSDGVVVEFVCGGCCTKLERQLAEQLDGDLLAFVLSLVDAFDRLAPPLRTLSELGTS
jgi:hypothetical protein